MPDILVVTFMCATALFCYFTRKSQLLVYKRIETLQNLIEALTESIRLQQEMIVLLRERIELHETRLGLGGASE